MEGSTRFEGHREHCSLPLFYKNIFLSYALVWFVSRTGPGCFDKWVYTYVIALQYYLVLSHVSNSSNLSLALACIRRKLYT